MLRSWEERKLLSEPGILAAYCAARIMTSEVEAPSRVPKPFDLHRDGIVLSEGAGMLICESWEHAGDGEPEFTRGRRLVA